MHDQRDGGGSVAGKRWLSITLSVGVPLIVCLGAAACAATIPWLIRNLKFHHISKECRLQAPMITKTYFSV
jgi:hypothetical protein